MTISERKTMAGIPVERTDLSQFAMQPVTAYDFYGEFGAHKRVRGIVQVVNDDIIRLRGQNRFSSDHYYCKDAINKLKIEPITRNKNPFLKQKIVWSKE